MILRITLLLAITALLFSGAPVSAAAGDSGLPSWLTTPATAPGLAAGWCPTPNPSAALGTPTTIEKAILPPPDFILCTCELCVYHPDVICQISPSGYSIVCADYARLNCKTGPVD
ncbi:MAG TPA: hypothetical protein VF173_37365 [Thermoanaerobaculia bacterium]|nr:hypothetical protein [Thermoanaerobaculia bacterium]